MAALVSLLWEKNNGVIERYVRSVPSKIVTLHDLFAGLDAGIVRAVTEDAAARAVAVREQLAAACEPREGIVTAGLAERLKQSMLLLTALDRLHERDGVELVALNEDLTLHGKTVAAWAKSRGVPSVVLSHSCILGRLYTVHREANADRMGVFGARGAEPYLDMGVSREAFEVTGNPAWDVYAEHRLRKNDVRAEMRARHGFRDVDHVVLFATTWPAFYTAFCDPRHYETSLRAAVSAVRQLRDLGVPIQLVIKERPSNAGRSDELAALLKQEAIGFSPLVVDTELDRWVAAADAVVSVDSNVSIEALAAQTVAINLWSPMSWLNGPFFDAEDGVLEASADELPIALVHALSNAEVRSRVQAQAQARLAELASHVGTAASRAADLLVRSRSAVPKPQRYAWQELSDPVSVTDKGSDSVYYRSARTDMLPHIRRAPTLVLDVGCGAGATGAAVKERYPEATVVGIEINKDAAAMAAGRLDRVIADSVETLNFAAAGLAPRSIDLVFFPDVLEHLYDPWQVLVRLKPFLAPDAQVLASIPNVRNLWLLSQMLAGDWQYEEQGLLDVTHIRFFTRKTIVEMFQQTGYEVRTVLSNPDGRVPAMQAPQGGRVNVDMPQLTLKNMSQNDLVELRTLQFIVDAAPLD